MLEVPHAAVGVVRFERAAGPAPIRLRLGQHHFHVRLVERHVFAFRPAPLVRFVPLALEPRRPVQAALRVPCHRLLLVVVARHGRVGYRARRLFVYAASHEPVHVAGAFTRLVPLESLRLCAPYEIYGFRPSAGRLLHALVPRGLVCEDALHVGGGGYVVEDQHDRPVGRVEAARAALLHVPIRDEQLRGVRYAVWRLAALQAACDQPAQRRLRWDVLDVAPCVPPFDKPLQVVRLLGVVGVHHLVSPHLFVGDRLRVREILRRTRLETANVVHHVEAAVALVDDGHAVSPVNHRVHGR